MECRYSDMRHDLLTIRLNAFLLKLPNKANIGLHVKLFTVFKFKQTQLYTNYQA